MSTFASRIRRRREGFGPRQAFAASALVIFAAVTPLHAQIGTLDGNFATGGRLVVPFDLGGSAVDECNDLAVQPDGRVVAVGSAEFSAPDVDFAITRFLADGQVDTSFGTQGKVTLPFDRGTSKEDRAQAVAIQADGKIVVAGWAAIGGGSDVDFAIARLNSDGSRDVSFDGDGVVTVAFDLVGAGADYASDVVIQPDGKIVVIGSAQSSLPPNYSSDCAVARLLPNGSLDTSFSGDGKATVAFDRGGGNNDLCLAGAVYTKPGFLGLIAIAGRSETATGWDSTVARLTSSGALDAGFGVGGKLTYDYGFGQFDTLEDVAIDSSSRLIGVGYTALSANDSDMTIVRLLGGGTFDTTFSGDGRLAVPFNLGPGLHDEARAVALQDDEYKILVAGSVQGPAGDFDFAALRINANGMLDTSFGNGGKTVVEFDLLGEQQDEARGIGILPSGAVILGGFVTSSSFTSRDFAFTRLKAESIFSDGFESGNTLAWQVLVP